MELRILKTSIFRGDFFMKIVCKCRILVALGRTSRSNYVYTLRGGISPEDTTTFEGLVNCILQMNYF